MNKYACGLVSVSFRNNSPEEIVKAVKKAGLDCVEWGSDVHAPCNDVYKINKIVGLQNKYGVYCSSYGTYFRLGRDDVNDLKKYIDIAKILGTDVLRIWCGVKSIDLYTEYEKADLYSDCIKAAKIAEENNVVLCMECHGASYTETVEGALELMNTVDSPNFRMYWQPNQYKTVEENIRYGKLIAPYCKRVHVFNWDGDVRLPLSNGKAVWKNYMEILQNTDTYLLEFMPDDKIESLKAETSALFDIVGKA